MCEASDKCANPSTQQEATERGSYVSALTYEVVNLTKKSASQVEFAASLSCLLLWQHRDSNNFVLFARFVNAVSCFGIGFGFAVAAGFISFYVALLRPCNIHKLTHR